MTTITTAPRRPAAPWMLVLVAAVLIGGLAVSGARLTWEVPALNVRAQEQTPTVSTTMIERANALAAARGELAALRAVVRENPSIGGALRDETQLLAAVGAGHVPIEALDRHDDRQLEHAVSRGHVPNEALEPLH